MSSRLKLREELIKFCSNLYFQPPSGQLMKYPCIIYSRTGKSRRFGNDKLYIVKDEYSLIVIDKDPDSTIADNIEENLKHCKIEQRYTVDNLNHSKIQLYF